MFNVKSQMSKVQVKRQKYFTFDVNILLFTFDI